MIYLDSAATTFVHPKVAQAVTELMNHPLANASSSHKPGMEAKRILAEARRFFADHLRLPTEAILFTSGGTESINLALKGVCKEGDHLITGALEHAAVLECASYLAESRSCRWDQLKHDPESGAVIEEDLLSKIKPDTKLVSIQMVNSETGATQDIPKLSKLIKEKAPNCLVHVDAVQAFGKMEFSMAGIDLLTLSAHKFRALPGAGILALGRPIPLEPLLHGGGQEQGMRSGTENLYALHAMKVGAELALKAMKENRAKVEAFRAELIEALEEGMPEIKIYQPRGGTPHILNLSVPGVLGEVLLNHLSERGLAVSTGSACNARSKKLSKTLKALGFADARIKESLRLSFHADFLPDSAQEVAETLMETAKEIIELGL